METSLQLRNKAVFDIAENKISKEDQVILIGYLMQSLNTTSVSAYAKANNISHNGAKLRVRSGKVKGVYLDGKLRFIVP